MPGLIEQGLDKNNPLATVQGYDASTVQMGDDDSVEKRIAKITSSGSDLNQLADTRSKQEMNGKGLLNSSMAIGAGQKAVLESALPIASQDANTASTFKLSNQNATNSASQFNAGERNQAAGLLEQGNQQIRNIGESAKAESTLQKERIGLQTESEKTLIAERGKIERELQTADLASRRQLLERQGEIDNQLQTLRGTQEQNIQLLRGSQETSLQNLRGTQEKDLLTQQGQQDYNRQLLSGVQETALQQLRGEQAKQLSELEGRWQLASQQNESAAIAMSNHSIALGEILRNENIPIEQKRELIGEQIELMNLQLGFINAAPNVNLTGILNFGGSGTGTTTNTGTTGTTGTNTGTGTGTGTGTTGTSGTNTGTGTTGTNTATNNTGNSVKAAFSAIQDVVTQTYANREGGEIEALNQMYNFAVANNKSVKQIATELEIPESAVLSNLAKINKTLPMG